MFPERIWKRRDILRLGAGIAGGAFAFPWPAFGQSALEPPRESDDPKARRYPPGFVPAHVRYKGGRWQEYPSALSSMLHEVRTRTSIDSADDGRVLSLSDPALFDHPFVYISGRYEFEMPIEKEIDRLRRHLTYGGFMLVDDGLGFVNEGFGKTVRELIRRLYPREPLEPLPSEHAVFRSYYLVRSIGGRQSISQALEGIQLGKFTPVIFCRNDLGGAWAKRPGGEWAEDCRPGGEPQRKAAFQLAVNIALYAMTGNYKQDLIHHPIIQRRLNQG